MPDQLHQPSAEIVAHALIDAGGYAAMYAASIADPEGFWRRGGEAARLDQALHQGEEHLASPTPTSRSNGSRTACSTSRPTASTATSPPAPSRPRSSGSPTTPASPSAHHLPRAARSEVCRFANVLQGARRRARATASCIYLPMIPEAAYAMLACARIGAVHSIVFAGFSPDALRTASTTAGRQGRRSPPTRRRAAAASPPQGQRQQGAGWTRTGRAPAGGPPHRQQVAWDPGPRPLAARGGGRVVGRLPARADGRRGSAVHPLHLGLDRQAQGRRAHHGRLPALRRDDAPATSSTTTTATSSGAPPTSAG